MNAKSNFPNRLFQRYLRAALGSGLAVLLLLGCARQAAEEGATADDRIRILTTATMVRDMVEAVGGERIAVDNLMGPGVDPHLYRPSVMDLRRVDRAAGIFYVGLHFEELMQAVFDQRKQAGHKVFALSDAIPREKLLDADDIPDMFDPHIWFDAELWAECVDTVLEGLIELDPDGRAYYEERADTHRRQLRELHAWALEKAAELPDEKRILVTSHDAYNYFGRAYGFQVIGLMGISTASEAGLADMTRLIDFIRDNRIPAIFVESSVSPRAIQRVSRDSGARVGGELFSDALGAPGEERLGFDVGTYDGMIRYNLTTIVEALRE